MCKLKTTIKTALKQFIGLVAAFMGKTAAGRYFCGQIDLLPYACQPKFGRKYVPPIHVDLTQGAMQTIDEIQDEW